MSHFAEAEAAGGYGNNGDKGQTPKEYCKQKYLQAQKEAELEEAEKTCESCGKKAPQGKELMKCSRCLSAWYCSKVCQIEDWKKVHKKACKKLRINQINDWDKKISGVVHRLPWTGIALSESLTGCSKEVLCHIAPWDLTDQVARRSIQSKSRSSNFRKNVAKSIKYFFKTYRTSATAASQISVTDIGNMCTDAVYLFWLGDPRVRKISVQEGLTGRDKFGLEFFNLSPVRKDWNFHPNDLAGLSPDHAATVERAVEKYRNDPRYGERED